MFSASDMPNLLPIPSQPSASSSRFSNASNMPISGVRPVDDRRLDIQKPTAMWHVESGLIVSPNRSYVPQVSSASISKHGRYTEPSMLNDDVVYLAFTPRFVRNEGDLFGRLNLNRQALNERIVTLRNGKFILDAATLESWTRLENSLLDMGDVLLRSAIPRPPALEYPKFPWECGYRDAHAKRDDTLRCVLNSQKAFLQLSAVVSFALSLYIDESGTLDNAYATLSRKSIYTVNHTWWDWLTSSYICNFSPSFRVGGFLNPYESMWMGHVKKFVQARVPIWILWGHHHKLILPVHKSAFDFSPPDNVINDAQNRSLATTSLILPAFRYDPFVNEGIPNPVPEGNSSGQNNSMGYAEPEWDLPPPPSMDEFSVPSSEMPAIEFSSAPSSSSVSEPMASSLPSQETKKEQALIELQKFFEHVEHLRTLRLEAETPKAKQQRLSREEHAKKNRPMKSSTVFVWQEQEDGTYLRTKVNTKQVVDEWSNFTPNQRRYTSHSNQWDLCPQLPRYSEQHPKSSAPNFSDDSDYESDCDDEFPPPPPVSSPPSVFPNKTIEVPDDGHRTTSFVDELQRPVRDQNTMDEDETEDDRLDMNRIETFDFERYLRDRYGYDLMSPDNWSHGRGPAERTQRGPGDRTQHGPAEKTQRITFAKALMGLSYQTAPQSPNVEEAVIHLVELLSKRVGTFADLPASFDHSTASSACLSLASDTLEISIALQENCVVYIVHKKGYVDKSLWSIATLDASTVLLIFRQKWPTVDVIAQELVQRGVPFRTVTAVTSPPRTIPFIPLRGLGARPENWQPTADDYLQYVQRRNELLKGPKGRAALLHGGIVARIARDILESNFVLDGPSTDASPVAEYGRFTLIDDDLTDTDLDIICGVYYVKTKCAPRGESFLRGTRVEMSWWPQDSTWISSNGYLQMEWTELAEVFYQKRLEVLRTMPETALRGAKDWKQALRKANTTTKAIEAGVAHYQAGYLEDHYRATRFVAKRH